MSATPSQLAIITAAQALSEVLDQYLLGDIAAKLTCTEANVLAEFLAVLQPGPVAAEFLACHAEDDDEGDIHGTPEGLLQAINELP